MKIDIAPALRGARVLAALIVTLGFLAALPGRAQAQIDISGDWIVTFEGSYGGTCSVALQQSSTELIADAYCSLGMGTLSGSIDPATGAFTLTGSIGPFDLDLQGTASPDGESISGTWDIPSFDFSGTFSGVRGVLPPTPTPGSLSGPAELDLALPDTGSGPSRSGGSAALVLFLTAGAALVAIGYVALRLRRQP